MFLSTHYAGEDLVLKLQPNEPWKKVFGPVFVYLNTNLDYSGPYWLWEDAKNQVSSFLFYFKRIDDSKIELAVLLRLLSGL